MRRTAVLASPFVFGIAGALLLQPHLSLPFENPWNVISTLTAIRFNPATNVLRFLVLVATPVALLGLAMALHTGFRDAATSTAHDGDRPTVGATRTRAGAVVWVAIVVAIALSVALNRSARVYELDVFHEGESLGAAVSWQAGGLPYSGLVFAHGVFQDPLRSVLAFELFGRSIGAARTVESAQKIVTFVLLALLLGFLFRPGLAAGAAMSVLAVALAARWMSIQPRDMTTMMFLLCVAGLQGGPRLTGTPSRARALCACAWAFSATGAFADSVDRGLFLLAGYVILAPLAYLAVARGRRDERQLLLWSAAGASVGGAVLAVALRGQLWPFFDYVFLVMPRYWDLMDGYVFPMFEGPYLAASLLVAFNVYWVALAVAGEAAAGSRGLATRVFERHGLDVSLAVVSLCFFRSALGRADLPHLTTSIWPTLVLALRFVWRTFRGASSPRIRDFVLAAAAGAGILIALGGGWRAYRDDLVTRNFPWREPDSRFIAPNYVATIQFLRDHLEPGEQFFAFNNEAIWYYFLDRPAPGRFYVPWFAAPEPYQHDLVADVEAARVRYVLYRNDSPGSNLDGIENEQRLPIVAAYLQRSFRFLERIDDNEIWIRRPVSGSE